MASKIDTITKRRNLIPRRDPYFERMFPGRSLGYRKSKVKGGTWIARIKIDGDGYKYRSLSPDDSMDYERAIKEATAWFELVGQLDKGADIRYSVKQCVADYISHLKIENSASSATRTDQSLQKHLVPALGSVELSRLTTVRLKRWRDGLVKESEDPEVVRKSKDTANRVLSMAKAAFNLAFRSGSAGSDTAWRRVPAFKDVGENRKLFLTTAQVDALVNNSKGQFKNLIIAARLTGARYGELANAKVQDLDPFNGTLLLEGKTGSRYCYLSDDALTFFNKLTKDRLPTAYLLVKDDGEPWGKSHQHRPMKSAVRLSKLPRDTVFYSIRHYHISKALLAGIPAQVVAENCGTSIRMLEKHYAKFMGTDRRKMMNEVAL
ncbi:MAG: tyrosine-type recombinase/integrase [Candidatus Thiodiazotropha sp. 'RUGA']|nr:tyrosine-type recombinase/integrase [Candidatus Thiodiazotropha sp. 'RUGA']